MQYLKEEKPMRWAPNYPGILPENNFLTYMRGWSPRKAQQFCWSEKAKIRDWGCLNCWNLNCWVLEGRELPGCGGNRLRIPNICFPQVLWSGLLCACTEQYSRLIRRLLLPSWESNTDSEIKQCWEILLFWLNQMRKTLVTPWRTILTLLKH